MSEECTANNLLTTRYFIAKCKDSQSFMRSLTSGTWACRDRNSPPHPRDILNEALDNGKVCLIFSINNCHGWHGYCVMSSRPMVDKDDETECNETITSDTSNTSQKQTDWFRFKVAWSDSFKLFKGDRRISFADTNDLVTLDGTPLNKARNWHEISDENGQKLCDLFNSRIREYFEKQEQKEHELEQNRPKAFIETVALTENSVDDYWKTFVKKVETDLGKVHLACPFGSQRYNLSTPESDIDVFIVYQAKKSQLLSFNPPKHTIKNSDKEVCDYTILEIYRYTELLLSGDPRCIETLFLHPTSIIHSSPEWRTLCHNQQTTLLLNRPCLDKYLRDAQGSNGIKLLSKWSLDNPNEETLPSKINKLCYVIIRLLQNARDIVNGEDLKVYREENSSDKLLLMSVRNGELKYNQTLSHIHSLQEEIERNKNNITEDKEGIKLFLETWLLEQRSLDFVVTKESSDQPSTVHFKPESSLVTLFTTADLTTDKITEEDFWKLFIEKVEQELGTVHLACPSGSQRYNLSTPESDIDVFIVYQAKTLQLLSFNPPELTLKTGSKEVIDYTILEIYRYTELLLSGDPRCIETLFLHPTSIIHSSLEWRSLCHNQQTRSLLKSTTVVNKYLRHAEGPTGLKLVTKWMRGQPEDEIAPNKVNKLCYILLRLLQNARNIVNGDSLKVYREESSLDRILLMSVRNGELKYSQILSHIHTFLEIIEKKKGNMVEPNKEEIKLFLETWILEQRQHY